MARQDVSLLPHTDLLEELLSTALDTGVRIFTYLHSIGDIFFDRLIVYHLRILEYHPQSPTIGSEL